MNLENFTRWPEVGIGRHTRPGLQTGEVKWAAGETMSRETQESVIKDAWHEEGGI